MRRDQGTSRLRGALAGAAIGLAVMPAHGAGATAAEAVDALSRQRQMNGIPPVRLSDQLTDGCVAHNAYMKLNGFGHGEVQGRRGWTPQGAMAAPGSQSAEVLTTGSGGWDGRWANPWGDAPLHLAGMFHPEYGLGGFAHTDGFMCMRLGRAGVPAARVYTLPGPGVTGVPTEIDASNELPYSPGDVVGVDDRAMGFNILVWRVGRSADFRTVTVRTAQGPVEVRSIDRSTRVPDGGTWNWMANIIVPVRPLAPDTTHTVDIVFRDGARHRFSFSTGDTVRAPQAAILRLGVDRLRVSLTGRVRARTARVIWQGGGRTVRTTARISRNVLVSTPPRVPGTYRVRVILQGRTLTLSGTYLIR